VGVAETKMRRRKERKNERWSEEEEKMGEMCRILLPPGN